MRALILLLASSWCIGYPALREPVYVLVSQPVPPAQELAPDIPAHVLRDYAPSSSSPEEKASQGRLSSLLTQDPLLKGGVLVAEPVVGALALGDPSVKEGSPSSEAFPILETLTVMHENPVVNHGRLISVTLTFLEEGKQALKGASLVESSVITRHEPVLAASDEVPRQNFALNEVETLETSTLDHDSRDSLADRIGVAVVHPAPSGRRSTPHVLKPIPVVESSDDAEPSVDDLLSVVDPAPVPDASAPAVAGVVDPSPMASPSAVSPTPVVEKASPAVAPSVVGSDPPLPVVAPSQVVPAAPLFVAEPPAPSAATPFVGGQFHAQDEAGQYFFGHWGGLNTRLENRDLAGRTSGSFAYVDPDGSVQVRKYVAEDGAGFRVAASDLPHDAGDLSATQDLVGRPVVSRD